MKCSCCGKEISSNERYCSNCGQNNDAFVETTYEEKKDLNYNNKNENNTKEIHYNPNTSYTNNFSKSQTTHYRWIDAYVNMWSNWGKGEGKCDRGEFWSCLAISLLISLIPGIGQIVGIVAFPGTVGIWVRRLHDVNKSGWNYLWVLTGIGCFYLIYLSLLDSNPNSKF